MALKFINEKNSSINKNKLAVNLLNITKIYPNGAVANENINFDLKYGEIHCLLGENGAGKSTLIKILFGEETKTSGKILINGKEIINHNLTKAHAFKMGIIHQNFALIDNFSIFENLILGYEIKPKVKCNEIEKEWQKNKKKLLENWKETLTKISENKKLKATEEFQKMMLKNQKRVEEKKIGFFLNERKIKKEIEVFNKKFNLNLNLDEKVKNLTVAQKQKTEILKLLIKESEIIIFDEPTSVLTLKEIDKFLALMKKYRAQGKAIIFITHKLEEIKKVGDRVTVLCQGKVLGTYDVKKVTNEKLINLMVKENKNLSLSNFQKNPVSSTIMLNVKNLNLKNKFNVQILKNINFSINKGEIVGLAGIENNGQKEIFEILSGIEKKFKSDIYFNSVGENSQNYHDILKSKKNQKKWKDFSSDEIKKLGISYIPQDRYHESLMQNESIFNNLIFNNLQNPDFFTDGIFKIQRRTNIKKLTENLIKKFNIKGVQDGNNLISSLSGGNQQKFVIAREISTKPILLVVNEPTWGVDIFSVNYIYKMFLNHRNEGKSIFFSSSNLNEIISLSDRVLVISRGEIVGEVSSKNSDALNKIVVLMTTKKKI